MLGAKNRNNYSAFWAFWFKARNRTTGALEEGGLWTGARTRIFSIGGQNRTYIGGGHIIGLDGLSYVAGASNIQSQTITLNGFSPEVEEMVRTYETRQADIEIHRVSPSNPLAPSGAWIIEQAFIGKIDEVQLPRSAADEQGGMALRCDIKAMSASRMGTKTLPIKKSDAAQKLTDPNDKGRQYSASKAKVTWMGETKNPHKVQDGNYLIGYQSRRRVFF